MKFRHILLASAMMLSTAAIQAAQAPTHTWAEKSQLAEGYWLKVSLADDAEDGVYQISYDWLRSKGFSHPERVGVYGYGGNQLSEAMPDLMMDDLPEVAVLHDAERSRILFYGQGMVTWFWNSSRGYCHRQNSYDSKAYYFLHEKSEDEGELRQMDQLETNVWASSDMVTKYDVHFLHEVDEVNIGQTGREKYGESFLLNKTQQFNFETVSAGSVRVQTNFVAYALAASTVSVSLNGTDLGTNNINRVTNDYAYATETTVDKTTTLTEDNGLSVTVTYTPPSGMNASLARLNFVRIQATRKFEKPQDFTLFRSSQAINKLMCYELGAATVDDDVQVWDVTSPYGIKRQLTTKTGHFCPPTKGLREYALVNVTANTFPTVVSEGPVANQNLHGLPATNMVILTAPAYLEHAEKLASYRRTHDGLHVTVLTPEVVYNEFSSGKQDVTAIRMLMKMFYDRYHNPSSSDSIRREPRYLLLWGDGLYDNKAIDRQYNLPCYETESSLVETSSCVCDDYFGFLEDHEGGKMNTALRYEIKDATLDLGIGRIPVNNLEQSANVLNKILAYGNNHAVGPWKNRLCFLSDDDKVSDKGNDAINCHVLHNEEMVNCLESANHKEFVIQKIYLPAYKQTQSASGTDYPDAKKEFQEALKQGVLVVNYAGHGNTTAITNENMMTSAIASQLNMKYLPLWVTASCDVSRWDEMGTSMGECLLLNPDGGAIALLSTVRVVYAQQNKMLNHAMIVNLFNRFADGTRYRLGDIMRAAKVELGSDDNKLNFCLMGDPSLVLAYPEQQVQVTEINGHSTLDNTDIQMLPALSNVTVKGRILKTGSTTETDSLFNGLLYPTFYDAADTLVADKGLIQDANNVVSFAARTKKAFAGRGEVKNGEFEFSFTVPIDIAYHDATGLANFYACSTEGEEASGFNDRYQLTGTDDYTITDDQGPTITELFLNSKEWEDGDVVNSTPYFFAEVHDESGFNATGNTVGHDIVLTIRCTSNMLLATQQHTLNNYFTTYTGDPTTGNVQYSIPSLEDGTYEATFRIWDVYNNPTTRKFTFTVQNQKAPEAVLVQAYPCPARMGDTITFRVMHNRPESAQELTLQVYTQTGHKVYETTVNATSASKVYARDPQNPTVLDNAMNADESGDFMGSAVIEWNSSALRPGFYLYRVFLSSNGSTEVSRSELLMVNP